MALFGGVEVNDDAYEKYVTLIESARSQNRKKVKGGTYYENHHVIPTKCGGVDTKENQVLLLGREHFVAHMLLAEMYVYKSQEWFKMSTALGWFMGKRQNRYDITPEEYECARILKSESAKCRVVSEETRRKLGDIHRGRKCSEETRKRMSISQCVANTRPEVKQNKLSSAGKEKTREKHRQDRLGKKDNDEVRKNKRDAANRPNVKVAKSKTQKGRKKSELERQHITESQNRPETKEKKSKALKGQKRTPEQRENYTRAQNTPEMKLQKSIRHSGTKNHNARACEQWTKDGEFVARYDTISKAMRKTGIGNIPGVCQGKRPYAGGFIWKYSNNNGSLENTN